jgi:nucleoside-diphosphate-sugar epimerase
MCTQEKMGMNLIDDFEYITREVKNIHEFEGKTILLAGATGLIGGYLVKYFDYLNKNVFKQPCVIIGLHRKMEKNKFLVDIGRKVNFVQHNISTPYFTPEPIDFIIHSASDCAPLTFTDNPLEIISSQVDGVRNLLELATKKDLKSFLYISTVEVYGEAPNDMPAIKEDYNGNVSTTSRRACYTESKRLSETICDIYWKKKGIPVKIIRPQALFGVGYGWGDERILPAFIERALKEGRVTLKDKGEDIRGFFYISDALVPMLNLLLSDYNGEIFNIAGDETTTIRGVADTIHDILGIKEPVGVSELDKFLTDAPKRVVIDNTKAKERLGLKQTISIKDGLKRTIEWMKTL